MTTQKAQIQLNWLQKVNFIYGAAGLVVLGQFSGKDSLKSFVLGWALSVVNLELFKRLGLVIFRVFQDGTVSPIFYVLLIMKLSFLGLVIGLFSHFSWIQAIPFILGSVTLLVAAFAFGLKETLREWIYARTS